MTAAPRGAGAATVLTACTALVLLATPAEAHVDAEAAPARALAVNAMVTISAEVQAAFGHALTWFLLLGAVRPVGELWRERRRRGLRTTDADQLARLTGVPATVWVGAFWLVTLAALALGAWLLLA